MYVYVWKDAQHIPFYVGMGQTLRRANPKNKGHRNKLCIQRMFEVGVDAIIIEIHTVANPEAAKTLERQLIAQYGRLADGTGPLTNISKGGEYHAAAPETVLKLRALWEDATHRAKISAGTSNLRRSLPASTLQTLRKNIAVNPAMKGWGERNGKDPGFDRKRIEGIKAAQPKRAEKMRDPTALAQRKERLKATLNSEEYKAKRAQFDTPEYREKLSAAKREYWAKKRTNDLAQTFRSK